MEQTNVKRLLHTLAPFLIMTLLQRLLNLIFAEWKLPTEPALTELFSFLPAAALALFCLKTFEDRREDGAEDAVPLEVEPLRPESPTVCALSAAVSSALMILLMTLLTAAFDGEFSDAPILSPLSAVSLILIHPLIEEYLFRWRFYRNLREMSPIFGCLAQAVMFAILHDSVRGMIFALACGAVLAFTVEETGGWHTALAAHIFVNLRSYLCAGLLADHPAAVRRLDLAVFVLGAAAAAGILVIRGRRMKQARSASDPAPDAEEGERL